VRASVRAVAERLAAAGAEAVIAACTEIPLIVHDGDVIAHGRRIPVISSTDALVERTLAVCVGGGHAG
jgi:aspartate racemase